MVQSEIINLLHEVGNVFNAVAQQTPYSKTQLVINEDEFLNFEASIISIERHNPWFTSQNTRSALGGIAHWLDKTKLTHWTAQYNLANHQKRIAIIMAGNIPLVGFHDFLCVLLSGHHAVCKFSSQDAPLWRAVLELMKLIDPRIENTYTISSGKLENFDAVIATGSNNTAISFKHYFEKYPNIIRQNRTSVALLDGTESDEELQRLADDIFSYFGFGCRNVTQLFAPENFDVQRLFANFLSYQDWINHHKYMNNYDYYRALYMMNGEEILENGFVIMRFNELLHAPPAVINCARYEDLDSVKQFLENKKEEIQAVVGHQGIPFGSAQCPGLIDYADGIDVMAFLSEL